MMFGGAPPLLIQKSNPYLWGAGFWVAASGFVIALIGGVLAMSRGHSPGRRGRRKKAAWADSLPEYKLVELGFMPDPNRSTNGAEPATPSNRPRAPHPRP